MKRFIPLFKFIGVNIGGLFISTIITIIFFTIYIIVTHNSKEEILTCLSDNLFLINDFILIVPLILLGVLRLINIKSNLSCSKQEWSKMMLPLGIGLTWFIADNFLCDITDIQMDKELEDMFNKGVNTTIGLISICIVGPIIEELLLRAGLLATLLRCKIRPWIAIILSAFIFGLIHGNMAQFISASIGGIILGIIYYKTHNVVTTSIIHILNNSLATFFVLYLESKGYTDEQIHNIHIYDHVGGKMISIIIIVALAFLCFILLKRFLKQKFVRKKNDIAIANKKYEKTKFIRDERLANYPRLNNQSKRPDPNTIHPIRGYNKEIYAKPCVTNPNIIVGNFTYIADSDFESHVSHHYSWIGDKLIIGKFCQIASGVEFVMNGANHQMNTATTYPFYTFEGWKMDKPLNINMPFKGDTIIGNDVWIGQNAVILPGVKIGDGAIIGANSVIGHDVEPYSIVVGNPARTIRKRFDDELISLLLKYKWWDKDIDEIHEIIPLLTNSNLQHVQNQLRELCK